MNLNLLNPHSVAWHSGSALFYLTDLSNVLSAILLNVFWMGRNLFGKFLWLLRNPEKKKFTLIKFMLISSNNMRDCLLTFIGSITEILFNLWKETKIDKNHQSKKCYYRQHYFGKRLKTSSGQKVHLIFSGFWFCPFPLGLCVSMSYHGTLVRIRFRHNFSIHFWRPVIYKIKYVGFQSFSIVANIISNISSLIKWQL